jgi:hypothetical protein
MPLGPPTLADERIRPRTQRHEKGSSRFRYAVGDLELPDAERATVIEAFVRLTDVAGLGRRRRSR